MSVDSTTGLEQLLRACGLAWMIDSHAPPEEAIPYLLRLLDAASHESRKRFGSDGPRFSEEVLAAEYERNPHKVQAFLQRLASVKSPQILVMIWRILQGMQIESINLQYRREESFCLRVVLSSPYEAKTENYESEDISDAAVLRHLGISKVNDQPVFDGFYPLRLT